MMMSRTNLLLWAATFSVALVFTSVAQDSPGAIFAVSDGKGQISLLWFPPANRWPTGGWKLSDASGQVLVPKIVMADPATLDALSVEDRDAVQKLPAVLANPDTSTKHRQLINILGLRAFSEPDYARALGLAWKLDKVSPGNRAYKVEALDATGKTIVQLTSAPIDSSQPTPLPPAPGDVQAKVDREGVSLVWTPVPENRQLPVIAYAIERDGGGQSGAPVSAKPVIVGSTWDPKKPLILDRNAPANEMLTYHVFSTDVFGRRGQGNTIRVFFPDFRALEPPDPVIATADLGKVTVSWTAQKNPNRAGFMLERSMLQAGPYEALSAQPLSPDAAQFEDDGLRGGTTYYYRVRSVNSRGDLGNPSTIVAAQPKNPGAPPKVEGLAADPGQTRVRLNWKPVAFPVAGYFVERRVITGADGIGNWVRLNAQVSSEPLYDDYLGSTSDAKMEYRVLAVAFDNVEGPPSASVPVVIPDRSVPEQPSITGVSGAEGKATLNFLPASPAAKTAQFLVLRSGRTEDVGIVIGDPLPGDTRNFTDLYASPGQTYWYRIVAVDQRGNRSDPTAPVVVRVGSPTIPKPATPQVQFVPTPYPHTNLQFSPPPTGFSAIVERQSQPGGAWIRIAGPTSSSTASDNAPPASSAIAYRISYETADGKIGPSSDVVTTSK